LLRGSVPLWNEGRDPYKQEDRQPSFSIHKPSGEIVIFS
jgi:hypothetical protein